MAASTAAFQKQLSSVDVQAWMRAAASGNLESIKAMLEEGADINVSTGSGQTALMAAAANGHSQAVEYLLKQGAKVNAQRKDGFTALATAAFFGHAEVVRMLLESGADAKTETQSGITAESWASSRGFAVAAQVLHEFAASTRHRVAQPPPSPEFSASFSRVAAAPISSRRRTMGAYPLSEACYLHSHQPETGASVGAAIDDEDADTIVTARASRTLSPEPVVAPAKLVMLFKSNAAQNRSQINAEGFRRVQRFEHRGHSGVLTETPREQIRATATAANPHTAFGAGNQNTNAATLNNAVTELVFDSKDHWQKRASLKNLWGSAAVVGAVGLLAIGGVMYSKMESRSTEHTNVLPPTAAAATAAVTPTAAAVLQLSPNHTTEASYEVVPIPATDAEGNASSSSQAIQTAATQTSANSAPSPPLPTSRREASGKTLLPKLAVTPLIKTPTPAPTSSSVRRSTVSKFASKDAAAAATTNVAPRRSSSGGGGSTSIIILAEQGAPKQTPRLENSDQEKQTPLPQAKSGNESSAPAATAAPPRIVPPRSTAVAGDAPGPGRLSSPPTPSSSKRKVIQWP